MKSYEKTNPKVEVIDNQYYLVFINPHIHSKVWKIIRLMLEIKESEYILYYDYEIEFMQLHAVSKSEYKDYNYNPN